MQKGVFISIEGGEGAGKTTLIRRMEDYIQAHGRNVVTTREPGGIDISEQIRSIILQANHTHMDGRTEVLLYAAARRQHLVERIIPALEEGKIVLCDRFIDSSLAYQGYARGIGVDEVLRINRFAIEKIMPDITFYLSIDPQVGLARIAASEEREVNRLDQETIHFHRQVQKGYRELTDRFPQRMVTVDASVSKEEVFTGVMKVLRERISL